jgi:hypothetical protein
MTIREITPVERYVTGIRDYVAARPLYVWNGDPESRSIEATLEHFDGTTTETLLTHDQIIDLLLEEVTRLSSPILSLPPYAQRTLFLASKVAVEHVVSDRDTGSSLASWSEPLALVEDTLARALTGVKSVSLEFTPV